MPRRVILKTSLSPGDLCTLTAAIESLHRSYPGWFLTGVRTCCDELFAANPHITPLADEKATTIEMHYTELLNRCGAAPVSFLAGYCRDLGSKLGVALELQTNRPHLYVTDDERSAAPFGDRGVPEHYWLVSAGIKRDFTLKQWPVEYYQSVIDYFRGKVCFVQIGSAEHDHPTLEGTVNLVGQTSTRQLIALAYHAQGGLGPITFLQHLCAAFEKPYVALLGGREPVTWTQYPLQTTLHTLGKLPCCRTRACWRSRVVALNDGSEQDRSLCEAPVLGMARPVGKCMAIIRPEEVIRGIEACYEGGAMESCAPQHLDLHDNDPRPRHAADVKDEQQPLDMIATQTGTDKGTAWHGYTRLYERYLAKYGPSCLLLEIGVSKGASLAMWRRWRPSWRVIGIDVDPGTPADFHGDGADVSLLPPDMRCPDIIIDDGSHHANDVIRTFLAWWPRVKPGGVCVVEDLHCSYHEPFTRPWHRRPVDFFASLIDDCMDNGSGLDGACQRAASDTSQVESIHFHRSIVFVFKRAPGP